jgi:hypothetical protein
LHSKFPALILNGKMTNKRFGNLLVFIFLLLVFTGFGQKTRYKDIHFLPPLDISLQLSGTFGELRSNHFHSGIDIKTEGVVGQKVYAIEDGYVSRIKIATGGYGKALYITHPNGYVSVYGHLQRFNDTIQQYVKKLQYRKERYAVESFPEKGELKVRKGEIVAFTGNTGGSEGPHLHFEIREEATQYPVNPLFFDGIRIADQRSPRIAELGIYPLNRQTFINGKNDTAYFVVEKKGSQYALATNSKITVSGAFSLGIRTYDQMNENYNKNGVYRVELLLDDERVFGLEMDKLSFATTRYLNSLIDYRYFKLKKRRLIRTQIDTNNRLFNYQDVSNNGIFSFSDTLTHSFQYTVSDAYDNISVLTFVMEATKKPGLDSIRDSIVDEGVFFKFSRENVINERQISLKFPVNTFYRSLYFQMHKLPAVKNNYSPLFRVHNQFTPVQKHFTISIVPDTVPLRLKSKMYIAYQNNENVRFYIGAKWDNSHLTAKSRLLGDYLVLVDTISPEIKPFNFFNGKNISKQNTLKVTIKEKQTGIKSYRGTLNGHWILMEYDPKKNRLTYAFDEYLKRGENNFKLVVQDLLDNESVFEAVIIN